MVRRLAKICRCDRSFCLMARAVCETRSLWSLSSTRSQHLAPGLLISAWRPEDCDDAFEQRRRDLLVAGAVQWLLVSAVHQLVEQPRLPLRCALLRPALQLVPVLGPFGLLVARLRGFEQHVVDAAARVRRRVYSASRICSPRPRRFLSVVAPGPLMQSVRFPSMQAAVSSTGCIADTLNVFVHGPGVAVVESRSSLVCIPLTILCPPAHSRCARFGTRCAL